MSCKFWSLFFITLFFNVSLFASQCVELFPTYIAKTSELFKTQDHNFFYSQLKDSGLSEKSLRLEILHELVPPKSPFYDHVRVRAINTYNSSKTSYEGLVDVLHIALDGAMSVKSYPIHVVEGSIINKANILNFLAKEFKSQFHILDLKTMLNEAYQNKDFLKAVIQDVAKHHNWGALDSVPTVQRSGKGYRLKNYFRLKEKVFSRTLDKMMAKIQRPTSVELFKIERVDDLLAARIVVKSSSPLLDKHFVNKNLTKILKKHKAKIVNIEKKGVDDVKASGYSAVHITIANSQNRHEIQIMTEAMSIWHRWEHHIYKTKHLYNKEYRMALESYSRDLAELVSLLEKQISQKKLFFKTRKDGVTEESFAQLNQYYQKHYRIQSEHIFTQEHIAEVLQAK